MFQISEWLDRVTHLSIAFLEGGSRHTRGGTITPPTTEDGLEPRLSCLIFGRRPQGIPIGFI